MQQPPRERTPEEVRDQADEAYELHKEIVGTIVTGNQVVWELAEKLYRWDEMRGWTHLGSDYRTVGDWLADPEVGMARSTYFRLTGLWRELVVRRKVDTSRLADLEPLKVNTVIAAVKDHRVDLDEALEDAKSMGQRDLRETYRAPARQSLADETEEEPDGNGDSPRAHSVDDLNKVARGEVLDDEDEELAQNGDVAPSGQVDVAVELDVEPDDVVVGLLREYVELMWELFNTYAAPEKKKISRDHRERMDALLARTERLGAVDVG